MVWWVVGESPGMCFEKEGSGGSSDGMGVQEVRLQRWGSERDG